MNHRQFTGLLACLFVASILVGGQSQAFAQSKELKLPDTHAGRCAEAFIKTFNAGSDDVVRAFEGKYRAKSALEARSIEDRVEQYAGNSESRRTARLGSM